MKQPKAALAKLDGTTSKGTESSRKSSKKHKETDATASQPDPDLQAKYVSNIKQAQEAAEKAKATAEQAALDMFQLYVNLLSINAKYLWNKITQEQMAFGPYTDLPGCSNKGSRGFLFKSFNDCVMFHFSPCFPTAQLSR